MIGANVSHYRVLEELGGGGMGVVYKAEDTRLRRVVALKFLPELHAQDPEALDRFLREARTASAINNPHICVVYEIDEHAGRPFIAMEYVEGQTIDALLGGRPLDTPRLVTLAIQIAEALEAAHATGIVHRDIKPANLIVSRRGQAKILDFGLAKLKANAAAAAEAETVALEESWAGDVTSPGVTLGTLSYMSPEQVRGEDLDERTDLFSFGAVLYEMATGRQAFGGEAVGATFEAVLYGSPPTPELLNPALPQELGHIVRKALEKDRALRYQGAAELLSDLRRLSRDFEASRTQAFATGSEQATIGSIAILPFHNAAGDPEVDYLCEGIPAGLINNLSQLQRLRVMAWSTVARYRGEPPDPQALGRELGVGAVLVGRVSEVEGALLIGAELIDVANGWQLWGDRFNRRLDDLFAVQEEITREISRRLRLTLSGDEAKRLEHRKARAPMAHQAYLTGRYHWNKWTSEGFLAAVKHFERAIDADPDYALGYAGLADTYSLLGLYALVPPKQAFPKAKHAAAMALALDNSVAEAHAALGLARFFHEWDWAAAEGDLARAIEMNPGSVRCRHIHSMALNAMGRHAEALSESQVALELDPLSLITILNVGWVQFHARNWRGAIEQCRRALELDSRFPRTRELLALACAHSGQLEEAAEQARQVAESATRTPRSLAVSGYTFAVAGAKAEARKAVATLRDLAARQYVPALSIAFVSAALGKKDTAFGWLERAFDEQDSLLVWLRVDPRLDNLRADPRFDDLVKRVGTRLWH
jgi:serine/threonine protein kinase/Tfp pilus assembly protein PilF